MAAAQSEDGVGSPNCKEHARAFETRTDDRLASSFDDAGANKQMLTAILGISHALRVALKVFGLGADLLGNFGIVGIDRIDRESASRQAIPRSESIPSKRRDFRLC